MNMQNSKTTLDFPSGVEIEWNRTLGKIYQAQFETKTRVEAILGHESLDRLMHRILTAPNSIIAQC